MKIVLKTLKGEMINLDINPESTVYILVIKDIIIKITGQEIKRVRNIVSKNSLKR
jgi:hypothetical protein